MIKAQRAVVEMRGRHLRIPGAHTSGRLRLQTDYASHECRNYFFEQCKKAGIDVRKQSELNNSNVNAASPKIAENHHVSRYVACGPRPCDRPSLIFSLYLAGRIAVTGTTAAAAATRPLVLTAGLTTTTSTAPARLAAAASASVTSATATPTSGSR